MFCWKILSTNDECLIVLEFLGNFNELDYREFPQRADHDTRQLKSIQRLRRSKSKNGGLGGEDAAQRESDPPLLQARGPGKGQHED